MINNPTFADCVDVMIRHFANMMFFDQFQNKFVLPEFRALPTPYYTNLIKFYGEQTPAMANDGSNRIRGLWNRVVADLNWNGVDRTQDATSIRYNKRIQYDNTNEVDTGFVNFIKIWQKLLGTALVIAPYDMGWNLEQKQRWLENSLTTLIQTLNPTFKKVDIRFDKITEGFYNELFGNIKFEITNKEGSNFSFSLDQSSGHGALNSIRYNEKTKGAVDFFNVTFSYETLGLINPKTSTTPLYQIFATEELSSDGQKLSTLQKITDVSLSSLPLVNSLLKSVNLQDAHTRNEYLDVCCRIKDFLPTELKINFISKLTCANTSILRDVVNYNIHTPELKHVILDKDCDDTILIIPDSVIYLYLQKSTSIKGIDLSHASKIEKLELEDAKMGTLIAGPFIKELIVGGRVRYLDLTQENKIEKIKLGYYSKIESFKASAFLKELIVEGSVKHLDLTQANQLEKITLTMRKCMINELNCNINEFIAPPSLKELIVEGSVKHLDLTQANQLEKLHLGYGSKIGTLIACPSLKELIVEGSGKHLDLTQADQLEKLHLACDSYNTINEFTALPSLKELTVEGRSVEHLDLTHAKQLKKITLGSLSNIRSFKASAFLKELIVEGHVKNLDLTQANQLEKITLPGRYSKINELIAPSSLNELTIIGGSVINLDLTQASSELILSFKSSNVKFLTLKKGQVFKNFSPSISQVNYVP